MRAILQNNKGKERSCKGNVSIKETIASAELINAYCSELFWQAWELKRSVGFDETLI